MIYTRSSREFVFSLIGVDDALDLSIIEQLAGEPGLTPTPVPSAAADPSPSASGG